MRASYPSLSTNGSLRSVSAKMVVSDCILWSVAALINKIISPRISIKEYSFL